MYALLLALGIIVGAIGVFTIGFGISVFQSSFGNSLIVAGTVAAVGGMIMFGLAAAVRQLRRIADVAGPRAVPAPRRQPVPESAEGAPAPRRAPGPPGPPVPYPPRPDMREPRPEARPAAGPPPPAPAMEAPEPPPMERPRPNIFGVARAQGESPVVEEPETVPLAPNRMPAAPIGRGGQPPVPARAPEPPPPEPRSMPEQRPTPEPRPASPSDIMARLANLAASPQRPPPSPRPEPPRMLPASERPPEARPRQNMFDALWPAEARTNRQSQSESIARAPKHEAQPEPDARPEPRSEPRPDSRPEPRPELRFEPPPRGRMEPAAPPREPMMPPPPEQRPIAILKSGVIDGMAYTLYTDGSIEAELPQGTMRFGSIDELRAHLESTERQ